MVENRLKLRRSLFLGTGGRLFVWRGRIVRVQHFTGDSISTSGKLPCIPPYFSLTASRAFPYTLDNPFKWMKSSIVMNPALPRRSLSRLAGIYAYLPLAEVLYREAG